jgi:DNA modification methylase
LVAQLVDTKEDWTFLEYSTKQFTHGFHLYPARMHPEIAKRLIAKYASDTKNVVFDPFMGSGGVLVEAVLHGNNAIGIDVNPFAVLLSKVKTTPIAVNKLQKTYEKIIINSKNDFESKIRYDNAPKSKSLDINFWYKKDVIEKLQILKHHIFELKDNNVKDFFKICFSLTSRRASNQRNGIYKIYRINQENLKTFKPDTFAIFDDVCTKNIQGMKDFVVSVSNAKAFPMLGDTRNISESFERIPSGILENGKTHLIVTSPPYGDHSTTVAYGQFSKHIGLWLELPQEKLFDVDSSGLGGKKKEFSDLGSPLLDKILHEVRENDKKITKKTNIPCRAEDVYAYFHDTNSCLEQISQFLKEGGSCCCFVVANRTVRRVKIPTDQIIVELGKKYGLRHIDTIYRTIANKAMAIKNAPENISEFTGDTMTKESIVIWKY